MIVIFVGTREELDYFYSFSGKSENIQIARKKFAEFLKSRGFTGETTNCEHVLTFYRNYFLTASLEERDIAAFNFWVYERFFMDETDPGFCTEHSQIASHPSLPEARSVGFWEVCMTYQFLFGKKPLDILGNISKLPKVPIAIVHGKGDLLCLAKFAEKLEKALLSNGYDVTAKYIDSGHKITNNPIREAVRDSAQAFADKYLQENL